MTPEEFDSIAWYSTWSTRELNAHRLACLHQAEDAAAWGGGRAKESRRLCFTSARRYAAEIARRNGR